MNIGCAILAGGKSSRMGSDKAMLTLEGKNFIQILMKELDFFPEKLIARGKNPDCAGMGWKVIDDIYPERGPLGGVHAALTICESDALFFVSCDIPLLKQSLVSELVEMLTEEADAVISVTNDGRKHPLCGVYKKSVLPVLTEQLESGNNRIMSALEKLDVKYIFLDEENSRMLKNINTPNDYHSM